MLDHGNDGLILLIVDRVEIDGLGPHLVSLALADKSWDHHFLVMGTDEVHKALTIVLGIHNT